MSANEASDAPSSSAAKRRRIIFNSEEKKMLCQKIKEHPCIWDIYLGSHSNNIEVSAAWREIAHSMEKSVTECRTAWKALRDSRRYHVESNKKKKSGDAGGIVESDSSLRDAGDWEFAEDMSFLPSLRKRRKSFRSAFIEVNDSCVSTDTENFEQSQSNYRYTRCQQTPDQSQELMSNINKFLEVQMQANPQQSYEKYAYMDSLLKKLPDEVAEDLMFEFVCRIREEIKRNNSEN